MCFHKKVQHSKKAEGFFFLMQYSRSDQNSSTAPLGRDHTYSKRQCGCICIKIYMFTPAYVCAYIPPAVGI